MYESFDKSQQNTDEEIICCGFITRNFSALAESHGFIMDNLRAVKSEQQIKKYFNNLLSSSGSTLSSSTASSHNSSMVMELNFEEEAILLEQARKDPSVLSPILFKHSKSSSFRTYVDSQSVWSEETLRKSQSNQSITHLESELGSATVQECRYIHDRRAGAFQYVNLTSCSQELVGVYYRYRMKDECVQKLMKGVSCSLPLYHHNCEVGIPPVELRDVCSEPSASNFFIRGHNYLIDAVKVPSNEGIFSLLGADNIIRANGKDNVNGLNISGKADSYVRKFRLACRENGYQPPFILVVNFVVPWGNLLSYYYRPDGSPDGMPFPTADNQSPTDQLLAKFLSETDSSWRNKVLKFIPNLISGPWILKRMVGSSPALIGTKLPTSYFGSIEEGYLEICLDVSKGSSVSNSICSAVASKSSVVTIDLAFLLEATDPSELPERLLTTVRFHHVSLTAVE